MRSLSFIVGPTDNIPPKGLVICDEASMIDDDLFTILVNKCTKVKAKILFVSDKAQLCPVKGKTISKVYSLKNSFTLTKIFRQAAGNPILSVLDTLRKKDVKVFKTEKSELGNIIVEKDLRTFVDNIEDSFKVAIDNRDILYTKVLAYTNKRVSDYNRVLHKRFFSDEEYGINEILTCYDNLEYNRHNFYNSMDYIVNKVEECDIAIPGFGNLPGYRIYLGDLISNSENELQVISRIVDPEVFTALAERIETIRVAAIKVKKGKMKGILWGNYYDTMNSFASPVDLVLNGRVIRKKSIDYGYAISIHKSQGSSLTECFVDMQNINSCYDYMTRRQLKYVALSRTRTNCYIFQP